MNFKLIYYLWTDLRHNEIHLDPSLGLSWISVSRNMTTNGGIYNALHSPNIFGICILSIDDLLDPSTHAVHTILGPRGDVIVCVSSNTSHISMKCVVSSYYISFYVIIIFSHPATSGVCSSSVATFNPSTIMWISSSNNLVVNINVYFGLTSFDFWNNVDSDGSISTLFIFESFGGFDNSSFDPISLWIFSTSFSYS